MNASRPAGQVLRQRVPAAPPSTAEHPGTPPPCAFAWLRACWMAPAPARRTARSARNNLVAATEGVRLPSVPRVFRPPKRRPLRSRRRPPPPRCCCGSGYLPPFDGRSGRPARARPGDRPGRPPPPSAPSLPPHRRPISNRNRDQPRSRRPARPRQNRVGVPARVPAAKEAGRGRADRGGWLWNGRDGMLARTVVPPPAAGRLLTAPPSMAMSRTIISWPVPRRRSAPPTFPRDRCRRP